MPNRVLFLDYDGVICTSRACMAMKQHGVNTYLDPIAVKLIERLVVEFNYKVVISSTWRTMHDKNYIQDSFIFSGCMEIPKAFHADWRTTDKPDIGRDTPTGNHRGLGNHRGWEIKQWLIDHPEFEHYLIIDDDCDMLKEQMENFVHVKSSIDGISASEYMLGVKISKRNFGDDGKPHD